MSQLLISRSPDLARLREEGYDIEIRSGYLLVKDVPKHVVADGRSRYDRWQLARHDARSQGATPSLSIHTAHEWMPEAEQLSAFSVTLLSLRAES